MSRKEAILEAARELFNETSTQSSTTNHIAKAIGISPGNLHYHYKNREEIIRLLYIQMRKETTLSVDELPKSIATLHEHEKILIKVQWKYRFFFKEMLSLFARDSELEDLYIKDNIAHRRRIRQVLNNLIINEELTITDEEDIDFLVDSISLSWQFYSSLLHTIGQEVDADSVQKVIKYTSAAMKPYLTKKRK
ncbi:transcriptional regulator, TetR family [Sulfurimonas gotlandica GD1]|uniref:Transcriptional regulator, TetR family n=1 Tax=Sulfurimonas gotlandica (strain DSM 19862 / JCM 16533 / GD1) TaxID=929558 RepID=B6BMI6_SULGG|nr:TetR/AcrR family transcriptional regulator [Sulfurimonas gotlandica]EDZ61612.1 transcriptional regulator, TetR family, putative [Sulfurimonas gotlandica GD1]EHP30899.1 transcriptional regulator, TetR family [Sulfurimonas gotlandica GD1]